MIILSIYLTLNGLGFSGCQNVYRVRFFFILFGLLFIPIPSEVFYVTVYTFRSIPRVSLGRRVKHIYISYFDHLCTRKLKKEVLDSYFVFDDVLPNCSPLKNEKQILLKT